MAAASEMASQQQAANVSPTNSRPGTASSNPASSVGGSPSTDLPRGSRPFTEEDLNQITINFMDNATGDTEGIKGKSFICVVLQVGEVYTTSILTYVLLPYTS